MFFRLDNNQSLLSWTSAEIRVWLPAGPAHLHLVCLHLCHQVVWGLAWLDCCDLCGSCGLQLPCPWRRHPGWRGWQNQFYWVQVYSVSVQVGLAISNCILLTGMLQWGVRQSAEVRKPVYIQCKNIKYWTRKPCLFTLFHWLAQAENKCKQVDIKRSLILIFKTMS